MKNLFTKLSGIDSVRQVRSDATNKEINNSISLTIKEEAYLKIKKFVEVCSKEIGGTLFGTVDSETGDIELFDIDLPPQEVSAGSVEYEHIMPEPEKLIAITEAITDENGVAQGMKMLGTWHSHVNMPAYASAVDENCAKKFLATPPMITNTLFITLVFNKKGIDFARIDYVINSDTITYIDNIDLKVDDGGKRNLLKTKFNKLFVSNVKKFTSDEDKQEEISEKLEDIYKEFQNDLVDSNGLKEGVEEWCQKKYNKNITEARSVNLINRVKSFEDFEGTYEDWKNLNYGNVFPEEDDSYESLVEPNFSNLETLRRIGEDIQDRIDNAVGKRKKKRRKRLRSELKFVNNKAEEMEDTLTPVF